MTLVSSGAFAKSPRAIEVLSDPRGTGRPTVYSIVRGDDVITFKHPYNGNFTRAEIKTRAKNGYVLTRFLLSSDGRDYRPVMRLELPFEKHLSSGNGEHCEADENPLSVINELAPKVETEKAITQTKDRLVKAGFFHRSCEKLPKEHRDAITMAAAEVFTPNQNSKPSRMVQCLEDNGFADVAGEMKARILQTLTEKNDPRLQMCCSAKSENPASFDEKSNCIEITQSLKPERADYAADAFHELCHKVSLRSHINVDAAVDCCVDGGTCTVLRNLSNQRHVGEYLITESETRNPSSANIHATVSALVGLDREPANLQKHHFNFDTNDDVSLSSVSPTQICKAMGVNNCKTTLSGFEKAQNNNCRTSDGSNDNEVPNCKPLRVPDIIGGYVANQNGATAFLRDSQKQTAIEQRGPIGWDAPVETTPVTLAQNQSAGQRGPASIPLPAVTVSESDTYSGGGSTGRSTSSRPVEIYDTVSRAADRVSHAITPAAVTKRKIELADIPARSRGKSFTGSDNQFVTASFQDPLAKLPLAQADFSGVALSFPNPFSDAGQVSGAKNNIAKNSAKSTALTATRAPQNNSLLPSLKGMDLHATSAAAQDPGAPQTGAPLSAAAGVASTTTPGTGASSTGVTANGPAPVSATTAGAAGAKTANGGKADGPGGPKVNAFGTNSARANADGSRKPASLGKTEVENVLTSSNYEVVERMLSNDDFIRRLEQNKIRVITKNKIEIGPKNSKEVYVFNEELGRLVKDETPQRLPRK